MGATYSTNKKAAAIAANNGAIYYVLYEETVDSNTFPRTPRWSACFFGTAEDCMAEVVKWSAACEGGILKGAKGDISPATYVKQWRAAMASPVELTAETVSIQIGKGLGLFGEEDRQDLDKILARHGHPGIQDNKAVIHVREQPELVADLIREKGYAGRYFTPRDTSSLYMCWASYVPNPSRVQMPDIEVFLVSPGPDVVDQAYWVRVNGGKLRNSGWEYSAIEELIRTVAVEAERKAPGSAEYAIRKIREAVEKKLALPLEQKVVIDSGAINLSWQQDNYKILARKLGLAETAATISTTLGDIARAGAAYEFNSLTEEAVTFVGLPSFGAATNLQIQLFAA